jgi:anti-anti-sigma factor
VETTEHIDRATATATVAVTGRLDSLQAPSLRDTIQRLLDTNCHRMVIDLSAVYFIDSAGLAVLIRTHRDLQSSGGSLVLVRPAQENANRIFQLTQFDKIFTIRDTVPDQ